MDKAITELDKFVKNNIDLSLTEVTFEQFSKMYLDHISLYRSINTILAIKTVLNHFQCLNDKELSKIFKKN